MKKEGWARGNALMHALALAAVLTPSLAAAPQFGAGPPKPVTVVQGGTVHVGNGDVIENGTVILRGSRIDSVGKGLPAPEGATVIDASGKHVYPGLIDAESTLMLDPATRHSGEGNLNASVVDALNPFDADVRDEALRGGVTTVGVSTRRGLFDGRGAVLKLKRHSSRGGVSELLLKKDGGVTATFGLNGDRPSMRLREWKTFADALQATKKYAEAWDEYNDKLEEYKKELEKAKAAGDTKLPETKKEGAPAPEVKKPEVPAPEERREGDGPRRPRRRPNGPLPGDSLPNGSFIDWLQEIASEGRPLADARDLHLDGDEDDHRDEPPSPLDLKDGVSYAALAEGSPEGAPPPGEKKEEGPKKPGRPAREPQKDVLRQVLEGKLAIDVYVDRAADVVNLLELAKQYRFRFIITGAREAGHVADELAAAGVPIVVVQPHDLESEALSTAATLDAAGVSVVLTTAGSSGAATRHLSLTAAAAIAGGMDREHALAAITSRAAALLGVADQVGSLEAGKDADVVITSGELFSSTAVVERVIVDGVSVVTR